MRQTNVSADNRFASVNQWPTKLHASRFKFETSCHLSKEQSMKKTFWIIDGLLMLAAFINYRLRPEPTSIPPSGDETPTATRRLTDSRPL